MAVTCHIVVKPLFFFNEERNANTSLAFSYSYLKLHKLSSTIKVNITQAVVEGIKTQHPVSIDASYGARISCCLSMVTMTKSSLLKIKTYLNFRTRL